MTDAGNPVLVSLADSGDNLTTLESIAVYDEPLEDDETADWGPFDNKDNMDAPSGMSSVVDCVDELY